MGKGSDLKGKTAVVTGASSGIGLQFCHELARRGCDLVMVSNQDRELRECAELISDRYNVTTHCLPMDLCEPQAARAIDSYLDTHQLDPEYLINNAGIFAFAPLTDIAPGKVECFVDLHVRAVTTISRRFANRFKARGRGRMLNMSSMSCWMPMPGLALYSATKAYIRVFTRALHYELIDYGVTATVACPGGIATDLFGLPKNLKKLALRLHAITTPEKFCRNAVDRMLAGKKQYINGWLNRFSIFFVSILPTSVRLQIKRRLLDKNITR